MDGVAEQAAPAQAADATPAPVAPSTLGAPVTSPAPTPSFLVDTEAFVAAAAGKEGYDVKGATELLNRHKGDIFGILKSATEAEKAFSSRMPVPDGSDPAKMQEVYQKLGVPAEATGYKYGEGIRFTSDDAKAELGALFKDSGVNNDGANKLLGWYQQDQAKQEEAKIQSINDGIVETEGYIQSQSGGLKGTQAYHDYETAVKATLASRGIDITDPANSELLGSDAGRKIIAFAYDYAMASQPGKIPGLEGKVTTVANIDQRYAELAKEMMANPAQWRRNPQKQVELDGLLRQKKQITK